jgi:hypothetical protein
VESATKGKFTDELFAGYGSAGAMQDAFPGAQQQSPSCPNCLQMESNHPGALGGWWNKLGSALKSGFSSLMTDIRGLWGANNPNVANGTTVVGAAGTLIGGKTGNVLGPASTVVSVWNDHSPLNVTTNSLSLLPEAGFPSAVLGVDTMALNWEVQTAGKGMLNAIPVEEGNPMNAHDEQVPMPQDW